jgi:hypothetical protein
MEPLRPRSLTLVKGRALRGGLCHPRSVALQEPSDEDIELARELFALWDEGRGVSKSQIELKTWGDATSHGRHFDRFIQATLGIGTSKSSKQSTRIALLARQVRGLGGSPVGTKVQPWEAQLQHARESCLQALRTWNDPAATFRTGAFSLMFVTAWNSLAIAIIQRAGDVWRKVHPDGTVRVIDGMEQSRDTPDLVADAFPGAERSGLRENVRFWIDLRNAVAHRHLPAVDPIVIPYAQAGLLNIESVLHGEFGDEYALTEPLTVPLQLSGFRDPGMLASRKKLQSALPIDVQAVISRADTAPAELLADSTFMMRVAFVPVVPTSGRNPDAIAGFVAPDAVPTELADVLDQYVVLPKVPGARAAHAAMHVVDEVQRRTGFKFNTQMHAAAARALGAWPATGKADRTVELRFAEYITSFKRYLYSQAWIDHLAAELSKPDRFLEVTGKTPSPCKDAASPTAG